MHTHTKNGSGKNKTKILMGAVLDSMKSHMQLSVLHLFTMAINHLVHLETFIREAFIKKNGAPDSNFFDLGKAYDSMWQYGVITDLHTLSLRGRLPGFLSNFHLETSRFLLDQPSLISTTRRKESHKEASLQ